jgi:ABC-2 type transport system permease protein
MSALLRAEILKLRTTRAIYGYLLLLVVLSGIGAAAQATAAHLFELKDPAYQRDLLSQSVAAPLLALLLGILSVTVEWRHGTITRTLLVCPRRLRVLVAKEVNAFVLGIVLALLGVGVAIAVAAPILSRDGSPFVIDSAFAGRIGEIVLASALWGALGAGVGAIVQHQAAALVGTIVWILIVESLVDALLHWAGVGHVADVLPRHALDALAGHEQGLSAGGGAAIGIGYVCGFAALAFLRLRRQDLT